MMPNWVAGTVTFKGAQEDLEELYTALTPGGKLSMTGISPIPADLMPEDSPYQEAAVYVWAKDHPLSEPDGSLLNVLYTNDSWDKLFEAGKAKAMIGSEEDKASFIKLGRRCISTLNKYGCASKMAWCIENWGVKWDFMGEDELGVPFDGIMDLSICTPWDFPLFFMVTLAKQFPTVSFTGSYSEDSSSASNCGYISGSGGVLTVDERPGDMGIYTALWGESDEPL